MSLVGKRVLITGASRGVGRAIAMACADEGATVLLLARDEEALQHVGNEIKENGGQAMSYAVDVSVEEQVVNAIEVIINEYKSFNVLINNTGRGSWGSIVDTSIDT